MFLRLLKLLASLRLTVFCLALGLVLVFGGTLAQVHLGLYEVQARYFRSLLVYWTPEGSHLKIPIFPGGWLIGGVLLINLIAGHVTRFQLSQKKIGIWVAHLGLILLLFGQFITEAFQNESHLRIEVGQTKSFTEDSLKNELVIIDTTNPDHDDIVSIPETALSGKKEIQHAQLPFVLKVKGFLPNSVPTHLAAPEAQNGLKTSQGIGKQICFTPAPVTASMDSENRSAALIEVATDKGTVGDWLVSTWLTKFPYASRVQEWLGENGAGALEPQSFTFNGHTYQIALRPIRYYKPYSLTLLEFRHDLYPGTDIPKNFSSKVHLSDPARGENRDVLIYMNNPLRYGGETFYQSSFEPGDRVSILQVVRNPASITPYVACSMITVGLLIQFLTHLIGFSRKRAHAAVGVDTSRDKQVRA